MPSNSVGMIFNESSILLFCSCAFMRCASINRRSLSLANSSHMGSQTALPAGMPFRPDSVIYGSQAAKLTNRNAAELSVRPMRRASSFTSGVVRLSRPSGSWKYTLRARINSSRVHLFCWLVMEIIILFLYSIVQSTE